MWSSLRIGCPRAALRRGAVALAVLLALACLGPAARAMSPPAVPASSDIHPQSEAAGQLLHWIAHTGNNAGRPYVVVDKRQAQVWVFDAQHRGLASSAALLGLTPGDHEVADIHRRDVATLSREARITPAGRFATEPGVNLQGEDVVWLDYAAGLAMHRVRPGLAQTARLRLLAAQVASAQRVSMGCVVLPVAFYEKVIRPLLGRQTGWVYVLPEHGALQPWLARWQQPTRSANAALPGQ
jgi:hypothetical protein